mmetsp:Transcript_8546/g.28215  ORF Transcript_8546/g.28215 Transcript_8546/m.28215 type:complete len:116 (+) Transcript_8546:1176-1523(+)
MRGLHEDVLLCVRRLHSRKVAQLSILLVLVLLASCASAEKIIMYMYYDYKCIASMHPTHVSLMFRLFAATCLPSSAQSHARWASLFQSRAPPARLCHHVAPLVGVLTVATSYVCL